MLNKFTDLLLQSIFLGIDVVSRSATSDATSLKERTSAIANMSIAQGAGFTFGPG